MTRDTLLEPSDTFLHRHLGPSDMDVRDMLATLGLPSLEALVDATVPAPIRAEKPLDLGVPRGEHELLGELQGIMGKNRILRSCIGMGYHDCITPGVILRNVLENPGWYTQYTPYQAEIAQGRLEALVNFQTMIGDLCGLEMANASLLDEGTAAAEAMHMAHEITRGKRNTFFVAETCHPQTIAVVKTRAEPLGIEVRVGDPAAIDHTGGDVFGVLVQYPDTNGRVTDCTRIFADAHAAGAVAIAATDPLALTLLRSPGEMGADIAIGSSQRFGVPMGFGGPHAGFMATKEEHKKRMPGRIIGVSKDAHGDVGYRLAIQVREQHIKREKATSNICTAQVLLAIMASMYAIYHGPDGLRRIARRVHAMTSMLAAGLTRLGLDVDDVQRFDTIRVDTGAGRAATFLTLARARGYNLRDFGDGSHVGISLDETTTKADLEELLAAFAGDGRAPTLAELAGAAQEAPMLLARTSEFLTHPVFNSYHCEHEMLRYLFRLQAKDISLAMSMIPLGSCTMKLNGTSEMVPVTWPEVGALHPFVPADQAEGYAEMFRTLEGWLAEITGFHGVSLQPNAGAQGEYAGLLVIRAYQEGRGEGHRNICLIPKSAHGTNPASAVMAGYKVVVVDCDRKGNVDVEDLRAKVEAHSANLAALMITYPSTHGVFEPGIRDMCALIHEHGGQVYMDGANMNAQVGLCRPGDFGADVCHLNLHKTFCIPHGGGGPGMGPICCVEHLTPYLPGHPVCGPQAERAIGPVSAAPYGSPSILLISWVYIALMGTEGLTKATQVAILNANYMAKRLEGAYEILYTGKTGKVAHEFILDTRPFKESAGVEVDDIAKRLMDFGFHAPTMSFPVPGTMMIEPTESESRAELDRFCDAMLIIREEIRAIEEGRADREDNALQNAPHTAAALLADDWKHAYSRESAAYPAPWVRDRKYWPPVGRIDNVYGDRNLMCVCPPMEAYAEV